MLEMCFWESSVNLVSTILQPHHTLGSYILQFIYYVVFMNLPILLPICDLSI
jgi:hypothetical protein